MSPPPDDPALLPFLPLLYVAWSDGGLTTAEIEEIRRRGAGASSLPPASRALLDHWLDPSAPPSAAELQRLLGTIRHLGADLPTTSRRSLAALGLELARVGGDDGAGPVEGTAEALADLEQALGVSGAEATRELLGTPAVAAPVPAAPAFDVDALSRLLDGPHREIRMALRARLSEPRFAYRYGLSTAEHRELVLEWLRELARDGYGAASFPPEYGGGGDLGRFLATFETLAIHDISLVIKFGVQFGLFGGSIALLGTQRHHDRYLRAVGTLALPGCFAMSELGHGSNVRDILTVARYDRARRELVVHTPSEMARKEWIGNAAAHARMATVFAQLEVDGTAYGVHAVLVPIRNEDGGTCAGVRIEDDGEKLGLNGVDNGRIWFDQVRVPRENLLNRYGDVSEAGVYTSPIESESRRFFTMLGTLVGGRISVAQAAVTAAKSGLAIAIRYGARRRQFGPAGGAEIPILDYRTHQRRLLPPLAATYALDFALKYLVDRFVARTEDDAREIESLAAGLKAVATWHTSDTLQHCREACGGQGYLAVNRIGVLRADTDVFTTFEGDNTVLMQLVARGLLTEYRQQFGDLRFGSALRYVTRRAAVAIAQLNPIVTRNTDEGHLRDTDFHLSAFRYREERLLGSAARRLRQRMGEGEDSFLAFNAVQDHLMSLARAHVERVVLEQFAAAVATVPTPSLRPPLERLLALYALSRIEADEGWFLAHNVLEGPKAKAIRVLVNRLCDEVRDDVLPLVDAFGIPDACLAAPIAMPASVEVGGKG